ncbi:MAG TPA: zf-HC2 domain-containing protein [Gemmatimonadaceae bacterium]|nr:zf-HC2 domain-containing protein [Gemmatimonadaceae bacterium]
MTTTAAAQMQVPTRRCEEVVAALRSYLAGTLPLSELVPIASHLEGCLPCMHTLELRRATLAVMIAAGDEGDGGAQQEARA